MALNFDTELSYSRDENDFLEEVNAGLIQPYMFEPEYGEAELARTGNTTEPPVAKEDAYSRRVGHTDCCSCKAVGRCRLLKKVCVVEKLPFWQTKELKQVTA